MDATRIGIFCLGLFAFAMAILGELALGAGLAGMAPAGSDSAPGWGIRMLALIDLALGWTLALMAVEIIRPMGQLAKLQGFVTLVLSVFGLLAGLMLIFAALTLLVLMVSLLLAFPFGTAVYLAAWGAFPAGAARAVLALLMTFKLVGIALLMVATPALLKNKGLLVLLGLSVGLTFLTGLLIGFVPGVVAAIADVLAALVSAVVGTVWMLVLLVGALGSILRAIRSTAG